MAEFKLPHAHTHERVRLITGIPRAGSKIQRGNFGWFPLHFVTGEPVCHSPGGRNLSISKSCTHNASLPLHMKFSFKVSSSKKKWKAGTRSYYIQISLSQLIFCPCMLAKDRKLIKLTSSDLAVTATDDAEAVAGHTPVRLQHWSRKILEKKPMPTYCWVNVLPVLVEWKRWKH